jgi:hypothetical protein
MYICWTMCSEFWLMVGLWSRRGISLLVLAIS